MRATCILNTHRRLAQSIDSVGSSETTFQNTEDLRHLTAPSLDVKIQTSDVQELTWNRNI